MLSQLIIHPCPSPAQARPKLKARAAGMSEIPSTQDLRLLVPKPIPLMVSGTDQSPYMLGTWTLWEFKQVFALLIHRLRLSLRTRARATHQPPMPFNDPELAFMAAGLGGRLNPSQKPKSFMVNLKLYKDNRSPQIYSPTRQPEDSQDSRSTKQKQ